MNVLFISFEEITLARSVRTSAMLCALADAGHRVDLLAPASDLSEHANIHLLNERSHRKTGRLELILNGLQACRRGYYDAVHGVDGAVFFARQLAAWARVPLVYDAVRILSNPLKDRRVGARFFSTYGAKRERRVLKQADMVFSASDTLSADLRSICPDAPIVPLEDIPLQSICAQRSTDASAQEEEAPSVEGPTILCQALPGHALDDTRLLMVARKVIETIPNVHFVFTGVPSGRVAKCVQNLDIAEHCTFMETDDIERYLTVVEKAAAIWMLPAEGGRYIDPCVYTLLYAGVPLVTLPERAYRDLLGEECAIHVVANVDSMAEGLLRALREPLLSFAVGAAGKQRVAESHTSSSFKHKVRMSYRELSESA